MADLIRYAATTYNTERYCAAFRRGALTVVRMRDGASCTLSLAETQNIRRNVEDYELAGLGKLNAYGEREPADLVLSRLEYRMAVRKWIVAIQGGEVIEFHPEPVRLKCPTP